MPTTRVSKSLSTVRRKGLFARVLAVGAPAGMPCTPYTSRGVRCVFSSLSLKCSKCIRRGVGCDGSAFTEGFDRLESEKKKLEVARQTVLKQATRNTAEAVSLNRRIELLKAT